MAEGARPIAWLALEEGTLVVDPSGAELGKVGTVLGDEQKDIFHGLTVRSGLFSDEKIVPADRIRELLTDCVVVHVAENELETLETYRA